MCQYTKPLLNIYHEIFLFLVSHSFKYLQFAIIQVRLGHHVDFASFHWLV